MQQDRQYRLRQGIFYVAAAAKHGEEGVADCAFEWGSGQAAVGFHVTDFGFDGAAAAEIGDQF
jgi:hypothetical protein